LAPLEAAAAGLPLVVTRNGGPSESLRESDQEFGILVDPDNPADIARGLQRVLGDSQTWERLARLGRQRVLDRYTWKRTALGYLQIIEQVMAHPEAHRAARPLTIHPYFCDPLPETDISRTELENLYFRRHGLSLLQPDSGRERCP
jgi:sucrose-phosphate synthase